MRANDLRAITSRKATGGNDFWRTPPVVLDLVRKIAGCQIGIDPCTDEENPTVARMCVCPPNDGLRVQWTGHGMCYVNPPYSTVSEWIARARMAFGKDAQNRAAADQCIVLIPARVDTRWWHEYAIKADAICFWRGRIRFLRPNGKPAQSATFPSAVLYWGLEPVRFKFHFQQVGWCVTP